MILADDKVWFDSAHKIGAICREAQALSSYGQQVFILAHFNATLEAIGDYLRADAITYQPALAFDSRQLCEGSATYSGDPDRQAASRLRLGLAKSFQFTSPLIDQRGSGLPVKLLVAEHHPKYSFDQAIAAAAEK